MSFYQIGSSTSPANFDVYPIPQFPVYFPVGGVIPFAAEEAPQGFLLCDGTEVNRREYSQLFAAIGTKYGSGDGVNTFALPDLRSRIPVGHDECSSYFGNFAGNGGVTDVTLTIPQMPAHEHSGTTDAAGDHNHVVTDPGHAHTQTTVNDDFNNSSSYPDYTKPSYPNYDGAGSKTWTQTINSNTTGLTVNNNGAHQHSYTTSTVGGNQSHTNVQPFVTMNYIIKF